MRKGRKSFEDSGLKCSGLSRDMIREADIVVDATPEDVGSANKPMYEELGKKAIFQGGEEHEVAGFSFVAQCNYDAAAGRKIRPRGLVQHYRALQGTQRARRRIWNREGKRGHREARRRSG